MEQNNSNYLHIEYNSHFYTNIDHILNTIKHYNGSDNNEEAMGELIDHLIIGLENTKKNGYFLQKQEIESLPRDSEEKIKQLPEGDATEEWASGYRSGWRDCVKDIKDSN